MYREYSHQIQSLWALLNYSIITFRQTSRDIWSTTTCRVQCVTWLVVRRSWWFQPGSSVQVVGPESTTGTWRQTLTYITAQPSSAWTRPLKWSKGWEITVTEPYSTRSRETVVAHCLVPTTSMDGRSRVSSARSNTAHVDPTHARTHLALTHECTLCLNNLCFWLRVFVCSYKRYYNHMIGGSHASTCLHTWQESKKKLFLILILSKYQHNILLI